MQATSTINSTNTNYIHTQDERTIGTRVLENSVLTELPGIVFAVLTLVYIVTSLVRL